MKVKERKVKTRQITKEQQNFLITNKEKEPSVRTMLLSKGKFVVELLLHTKDAHIIESQTSKGKVMFMKSSTSKVSL